MDVTIEHIEVAGPDGRARRLLFSDHSEPRVTSASVVRALELAEGASVPPDFTDALERLEPELAKERALRFLGYRDRSSHELLRRLSDDGYPHAIAESIVERLQALGLLDDARFAHAWARTRAAAGFGPQRVVRELSSKGVEDAVVREAVAEAFGVEEPPLERARAILGGRRPQSRQERDKMLRKLLRRGFDMSTAIRALDAHDE